MAKWMTTRVTDTYRESTNIETGAVRRVPFATDKQWSYLESLRTEIEGKTEPLKNRPTQFAASKSIDRLLLKKQKQEAQQKLI